MSRGNGVPSPATPGGLVSNIAEFGNDVATLAELQAKLTVYDAKDCLSRATIPLIVVAGASILAVGSVPVVLIGLADWIASSTSLSAGGAQLIVGLVSLLLAGAAVLVSLKSSIRSLECFRRSNEELIRNVSWLRTVLVHSGRTVSRPRV